MGEFDLNDTLRILRQLPKEARTWYRKAQRTTVQEFKTRKEFPGLEARFSQPVRAHIFGMGSYQFPSRVVDVKKPKSAQHPFIHSGAFRLQLLDRKPKTKASADSVRTVYSIGGGPVNGFGSKTGVLSTSLVSFIATYQMTCYRNTTKREGMFKKMVSRRVTKLEYQRSPTTYKQDWQYRSDELRWMQNRCDQLLMSIVQGAVFTKSGRIRSRFADTIKDAP